MAAQDPATRAFEGLSARVTLLDEKIERLEGGLRALEKATRQLGVTMKPKDYGPTFDRFVGGIDELRREMSQQIASLRREHQALKADMVQSTSVPSLHGRIGQATHASVDPFIRDAREGVKEMLEAGRLRVGRLAFWRDALVGLVAGILLTWPLHSSYTAVDYSEMPQDMRLAYARQALGGEDAIKTVIRVLAAAKNVPEMHIFSAYRELLEENEKMTACQEKADTSDDAVVCSLDLEIYPSRFRLADVET